MNPIPFCGSSLDRRPPQIRSLRISWGRADRHRSALPLISIRKPPLKFFSPTLKYAGLWDSSSGILISEIRRKGAPTMYEIEFVRGHVEVYLDGVFCFSADTRGEAEREIKTAEAS